MLFFKERVLSDSIVIDAPPEMIWDFFSKLEENYQSWHPDDHVAFRMIKGKPHEVGSIVYAEEKLAGRLCKIKMLCTGIELNKKIEYKTLFPLSIFHPGSIYLLQRSIISGFQRGLIKFLNPLLMPLKSI
jgi:ligand-binding SRPBCC domain-containing protein